MQLIVTKLWLDPNVRVQKLSDQCCTISECKSYTIFALDIRQNVPGYVEAWVLDLSSKYVDLVGYKRWRWIRWYTIVTELQISWYYTRTASAWQNFPISHQKENSHISQEVRRVEWRKYLVDVRLDFAFPIFLTTGYPPFTRPKMVCFLFWAVDR